MPLGCLPLAAALGLALVLPLVFADLMRTALMKLQIAPGTASLIVAGVFLGSLVNIPVRRIRRERVVPVDPLALFGLSGLWRRTRTETVIAVNVGGCVIPASLALYEAVLLIQTGPAASLVAAVLLNILVCYSLARPVPGVGILMPGMVPALVGAASSLVLAPAHATPVAFVAGTLGPLVGADLLHLAEIERSETGVASIGGAGTFDGIVLSGIVALYLA